MADEWPNVQKIQGDVVLACECAVLRAALDSAASKFHNNQREFRSLNACG